MLLLTKQTRMASDFPPVSSLDRAVPIARLISSMERVEGEAAGVEEEPKMTSLFPVFHTGDQSSDPTTTSNNGVPRWLRNPSFTTDLSLINDAVSSHYHDPPQFEYEDDKEDPPVIEQRRSSYELVDSSASDRPSASASDDDGERDRKKKRKKDKRKRRREAATQYEYALSSSRKPGVTSWASSSSSSTTTTKDYYFDSNGDRDNAAFGRLYRMDVARYKLYSSGEISKLFHYRKHYAWKHNSRVFDGESDVDGVDGKLKSGGRYWSAKYAALERHKNLKRIRIIGPEKPRVRAGDPEFIPVSGVDDEGSFSGAAVVEESWEDELLRKTREFNKMTRDRPHDLKLWLDFAELQDKVASMQSQKGARLQTLEKKISILEKATELNPDSEELLLALMNSYQSRDSSDILIGRWEKVLLQNSGSFKLWRQFLLVVQGEFSRFKVSEMRKMYATAIRALSAACIKQYRQVLNLAYLYLPSCTSTEIHYLNINFFEFYRCSVKIVVLLCSEAHGG
ncbi:unnamed protein product [Ilex paraguariensis]|uniref:Protein NRDE2 homolog n=1 Tax=Ilex paraguariensis TaxID=185542 RepID=A0ABC8T4K5_9AQUA